MEITFDTMPKFLAQMYTRLERMEDLLLERSTPKKVQSDLLTITEASEMLNLSIPTIYSKVSRRELPHQKKGKKLYFSREELLSFVKEGKRLTTDEIKLQAIQGAAAAMKGGEK